MKKLLVALLIFCTGEISAMPTIEQQDVVQELIDKEVLNHCSQIFHDILKKLHLEGDIGFAIKHDGSLVSTLELEIEKSVGAFLLEATPWAGFQGEEGVSFESQVEGSGYKWYLDPIDGTISFKNGIETFAFVLTLVNHDEAVAAIIEFPRLGKTYKAYQNRGATVNDQPISVKKHDASHAVFAVSDRYTFDMTNRQHILDALHKTPFITRTYTDIFGYSLVAEGKCAGKFDAAGAMWDLWPGYLLIKEAGGDCLFFPVEDPTEDLAGSMLVGSYETVQYVLDYLQEHTEMPNYTRELPKH